MKSLGFITLIIWMILFGSSCAKENLEIKGKVLDDFTKVAIPNREIIVQALVKSENKVTPVFNGKFSTDSSGFFVYPLNKVKTVYLYNFCVVGDSTYAYSNIEVSLTDLSRNGKFLSFNVKKLTDLTIIIDKKAVATVNDALYVSWESDGINGKFLYPYTIKNYGMMNNGISSSDLKLKWTGGEIKSAIKTKVFADKKTIIRWELYRNDKRKLFTDTVFCRRDAINYVNYKY
jgi:hypothetical protein